MLYILKQKLNFKFCSGFFYVSWKDYYYTHFTLKGRDKSLFLHLYVHNTSQDSPYKVENSTLIFVHSNTTGDALQSSHGLACELLP